MAEEITEPEAGSEEYNQQMIDKFNNTEDPNPPEEVPTLEMPEGGHEKFFDKETGSYNWEAHAKELEFNASGREKPEEDVEKPTKLKIEEPATEEEALNIVNKAGLDATKLEASIRSSGDLDESDYEALKKVGLPEDLVKSYVENINYRIEAERKNAFDYAGGEDTFKQMSEWAVQNMPQDEIAGMNRLLDSPDWKMAVDALKNRMGPQVVEGSLSKEPTSQLRGEGATGNQFGYRSKNEMKVDMASKEYANDPAFRQQVMQKMQNASWDLDTAN